MKKLILVCFAASVWGGTAAAEAALDCVSVIQLNNSQGLENSCSRTVHVFWCPETNGSNNCGESGKFYQYNVLIEPGDMTTNQYSLPLDTTIWYAACIGDSYTTTQPEPNGDFYCN